MTSINRQDRDLHNDDGTHRSTPPTTSGTQLELYERRLSRHLAAHADRMQQDCKHCHRPIRTFNDQWVHLHNSQPYCYKGNGDKNKAEPM